MDFIGEMDTIWIKDQRVRLVGVREHGKELIFTEHLKEKLILKIKEPNRARESSQVINTYLTPAPHKVLGTKL